MTPRPKPLGKIGETVIFVMDRIRFVRRTIEFLQSDLWLSIFMKHNYICISYINYQKYLSYSDSAWLCY